MVIASIMKQPFIQRICMVTMDRFHRMYPTIAHIYFILFFPLLCVCRVSTSLLVERYV